MTRRFKILGIGMVLIGFAFVAAGGYSYIKVQEGYRSLNAFSAAQNVALSYNEDGQLVDGGDPAEAAVIMALLTDEWGYPVVASDLDPNDPVVNTASEYMFEMATIATHIMHGTQTIVLDEPVEYNGETFAAGEYEFAIDGRYYADFDRAHPLEGPARGLAWSPTALGLIGQLGVGAVTHSTLQMGLGLAAALGAVGGALLVLGGGLVWAVRPEREAVPAIQPVTTPIPA
ncbi:MAG TPA: hypothetical protein VGO32_08460 [Candidatus Limnocylindria bacterium]|jgi:hypothetical protein|nr:hypothetical protein [Candidatus Limnocylindria bacterium]